MNWAMAGVIPGVNTTVIPATMSWVIFLVRDPRAVVRAQFQELRAEMRQQHQDLLVVLQGHTHDEEGTATFHQLTSAD